MRLKPILIGAAALTASFVAGSFIYDALTPRPANVTPPPLAPLPALPTARTSTIVVPVAIPLTVIRDLAERTAPRNFAGKAANPVPQLLQDADIAWTATRGVITASGTQSQLGLAAPISGTLAVKGALSGNAKTAVNDALGKLLGSKAAEQIGVNIKSFNANADINGTIAMAARPALTPNWRVEPNLSAQVALNDNSVAVSGLRVNVPAQVKPMIDKAVNEQLAQLQQRIRNDSGLERNARQEWSKLCRSIPLQGIAVQGLWLELRPTKALAAQPKVENGALVLTMGIETETRVTAAQTKPECPFPANLNFVPADQNGVHISVPIDTPFTEIDRMLEAQLANKTFPEDGSGAVEMTVKRANVTASGERLLISLQVKAREKASWFGLGGDATVFIWGKPLLDAKQQTLRLGDLEVAVESEAAFGLLGGAARAALPLVQQALADKAVLDLKPFATNLQRRLGAMIADYHLNEEGIRVASDIESLRLTGLAFDAKTLRVTAAAEGFLNVTLTALPKL
ncbi:uncharacterized protein DUF4403 [Rhodopseudomonas faecalis]|uniref:Uncharacterized protein DUF4403 n=1 Tax=Rhodopseudomonas faecalis TaxID=99655 RepID=A0A318T8J8_9BRAD|nr:DUF4403 family protein [Rhodopseudomonas faecalis]PYF01351.1 uncharacterized protein DUF4403 [Rhodopseudomonas faecalis]